MRFGSQWDVWLTSELKLKPRDPSWRKKIQYALDIPTQTYLKNLKADLSKIRTAADIVGRLHEIPYMPPPPQGRVLNRYEIDMEARTVAYVFGDFSEAELDNRLTRGLLVKITNRPGVDTGADTSGKYRERHHLFLIDAETESPYLNIRIEELAIPHFRPDMPMPLICREVMSGDLVGLPDIEKISTFIWDTRAQYLAHLKRSV